MRSASITPDVEFRKPESGVVCRDGKLYLFRASQTRGAVKSGMLLRQVETCGARAEPEGRGVENSRVAGDASLMSPVRLRPG